MTGVLQGCIKLFKSAGDKVRGGTFLRCHDLASGDLRAYGLFEALCLIWSCERTCPGWENTPEIGLNNSDLSESTCTSLMAWTVWKLKPSQKWYQRRRLRSCPPLHMPRWPWKYSGFDSKIIDKAEDQTMQSTRWVQLHGVKNSIERHPRKSNNDNEKICIITPGTDDVKTTSCIILFPLDPCWRYVTSLSLPRGPRGSRMDRRRRSAARTACTRWCVCTMSAFVCCQHVESVARWRWMAARCEGTR